MVNINVKNVGAIGDGTTNDTTAFQEASEQINQAGGGVLYIPPGTYVVGRQTPSGDSYQGESIIRIHDCPEPVLIFGKQVKLIAPNELKIGFFKTVWASAYDGMIQLENNDLVTVRDLELDGNIGHAEVGLETGNDGVSTRATGIYAVGNRQLLFENVHVHSHAQAGLHIAAPDLKNGDGLRPHTLVNVVSENNGAGGFFWKGGNALTAMNCKFNYSGRKRPEIQTPPAAGLDISPDIGSICENGHFINCRFMDNGGAAMMSLHEKSRQHLFTQCEFWSSDYFSVFIRLPEQVRFEDCRILGSCILDGPNSAFVNCHFEDADYRNKPPYRSTMLVGVGANKVAFDGCTIIANRLKAIWADYADMNKTFRDTTITHCFDGLPDMDFQSLFRGATLERVTFKEEIVNKPQNGWYINVEQVEIIDWVFLEGEYVNWESYQSGINGTISPTTAPSP